MDANDFDLKNIDDIMLGLESEGIMPMATWRHGKWDVSLWGHLKFPDSANPHCMYGACGRAEGIPLKHVLHAAYQQLQHGLDEVRLRHMSGEMDYKNGTCDGPGEHGDGCHNEATWLIGQEWWRLCETCAALPEFARKRKRRKMGEPQAWGL